MRKNNFISFRFDSGKLCIVRPSLVAARRRNARAPLSTRNPDPPPRLVSSRPVSAGRGVRTHSRLNPSSSGRGNACRSIPKDRLLNVYVFTPSSSPACSGYRREDDKGESDVGSVAKHRFVYFLPKKTRILHPADVRDVLRECGFCIE